MIRAIDIAGNETLIEEVLEVKIPATVKFEPESLNIKEKNSNSNSVVTAFITLGKSYSVANIKTNSILLNGKVPANTRPITINEKQNQLMVKFNRSDVLSTVKAGQKVEIRIEGLYGDDGTKFEGVDFISVK